MLILTRAVNETIKVDGPCTIRLVRIIGCGRVSIGIEAERSVGIARGELPARPAQTKESA